MGADGQQVSTARSPRWRIGIAECLAIAFAAVVILAIAANVITRRSELQRTEVVRVNDEVQAVVASGNAAVVALDSHHTAIIAGLESPQYTSAFYVEQEQALIAALDAERATLYGSDLNAIAEFQTAVGRYIDAASAFSAVHQRRGDNARDYGRRVASMQAAVDSASDGAWKIFGRVIARESLLTIGRDLDGMRQRAARIVLNGVYDSDSIKGIATAEATLNTTLSGFEKSLRRSQGEAWLQTMRNDLAALIKVRRALVRLNEQRAGQRAVFDKERNALRALLNQRVDMLKRTLPVTSVTTQTREVPPVPDYSMMSLTAGVLALVLLISIITVYRVAVPVRRLVDATRQLAEGQTNVSVPRGGMREVDSLSEAFNDMAAQLQQAKASVQAYQAQLEARVDERTRQLQHLAEHDPLTHLPNRRQLIAHLEGVLRRTRVSERRAALLFVDLDNFKTLNDSLGHEFGDGLLQAVSERLQQAIGEGFCARWGGDEFTLVIEGVHDVDDVRARSELVVAAFHRPLSVGPRDVTISVSVGASLYPDHGSDVESLLRAADAALFRAKELGRRQAHLFSPDLLEAVSSRFALEQSLRRAVKYGELELFYQPEVSLDTLEPTGVEALLRWRQPDGTYVTAGEFLHVAEQTGLINEISDWVLRTAIRAAARWHKSRWPQAKVAVNLSSRQLLDQQLVQQIGDMLREYDVPASCLEIELTENVLQTGAATIEALRALRALGVSIALDDFGTGFSSLTSLEQLPLSRVKIDRSLIASIDKNPRSAAIARSIVGLCHNLGLEVIAEGIERPEQLARLLVDRGLTMQGYLLSRPLPANELLAFLETVPARMQGIVLSLPDLSFEPDSTGAHSLRKYRAAVASKRANSS